MLWLCMHLPQLADRAALERLASWAYQWTSQVSYRLGTPALWLEFGASCRLFGGADTLLGHIDTELAALGHAYQLGLAPSPEGAALLARAPSVACRRAYTLAELQHHIAPLPLKLLALPPDTLAALAGAGVRSIGEVLRLPAAALARRFGPDATLYLRRLCGRAADPRTVWRLPPVYRTRHEFGFELEHAGALLFPLRRLLGEFQGYLRAADKAVQRFTLQLEHHARPASRLDIGLSQPSRDAAQFLMLLREHLAVLNLPAALTAVRLEALEFTVPVVAQMDFFGTEAQRLQQLQQLLDRLDARLGAGQVRGLQAQPDHRPERAWNWAPMDARASRPAPPCGARPCWLLLQPRRIDTPLLVGTPERIESGWWDGDDVARDYYRARAIDGARLWVFRGLRDGAWYLQGLWA